MWFLSPGMVSFFCMIHQPDTMIADEKEKGVWGGRSLRNALMNLTGGS